MRSQQKLKNLQFTLKIDIIMICTGGWNVATNMKVKYSKAEAIRTRQFKYLLTHILLTLLMYLFRYNIVSILFTL